MTTGRAARVVKVWADTIRSAPCNGPHCRSTVYFAQNVKTGRFVPFKARPVPLVEERELGTNRPMWTVDLAGTHFGDCPDARAFSRRGR